MKDSRALVLMIAALEGNSAVCNMLCAAGAPVKYRSPATGKSALHHAKELDAAEALVRAGAALGDRDAGGCLSRWAAERAVQKASARAQRCTNCGTADGALKKCPRCLTVRFCSPECQHAFWPVHKSFCGELAERRQEHRQEHRQAHRQEG